MQHRLLRRAGAALAGAPGLQHRRSFVSAVAGAARARQAQSRQRQGGAARGLFEGISPDAEFTPHAGFQKEGQAVPIFRMVNEEGKLLPGCKLPFSVEKLQSLYRTMVLSTQIDHVLNSLQRQGRISFYMTNSGEEAAVIGSVAGMDDSDVIWPQYRELGAFLYRGFTVQQCVDQCMSRGSDPGKGRQMPVHYVDASINMQAVTSPLGTQLPHAAGAGYAFRIAGERRCAAAYFGDGSASEGDFAVAINFAATLKAQTLFLCRNNGWAISTRVKDQYAGDGIASRGIAYGMHSIRVDGNDLIASYVATKQARELSVTKGVPVLVEYMTFRRGHHSTSDDAARYRGGEVTKLMARQGLEPLSRVQMLLDNLGAWKEDEDKRLVASVRAEVMQAMKTAEAKPFAPIDELFRDVVAAETPELLRQKAELKKHIEKHSLDLSNFREG